MGIGRLGCIEGTLREVVGHDGAVKHPLPAFARRNSREQKCQKVQKIDPKLYTYGVERPMNAIENLTATTLRNIIGEMELDQSLTSRDTINAKMRAILDEATDPWGIKVNRVELKNIIPPKEINYRDHAREFHVDVPKEPALFTKAAHTVIGNDGKIIYPRQSHEVVYEAELGVVIKKRMKDVAPEDVPDYILGYTCANDVTARDQLNITEADLPLTGTVTVKGTISNAGDVLLLEAMVEAMVNRTCGRCLKAFTGKSTAEVLEKFYPASAENIENDAFIYESDIVDLTEPIRESLLLAEPLQALCRIDCQGLCPVCGADRNKGDCGCDTTTVDPRLAALKQFIKN